MGHGDSGETLPCRLDGFGPGVGGMSELTDWCLTLTEGNGMKITWMSAVVVLTILMASLGSRQAVAAEFVLETAAASNAQATAAQNATVPEPATDNGEKATAPENTAAETPAADGAADGVKPWTLPQLCTLQQLGINMSGWVDQGMTFNSLSPSDRWNGPIATNDRSNEYELNQAWLSWERKIKPDNCGWDIGGRIDAVYGTDWRYGDSYGLESNINTRDQLYGLSLPQFYMEVAYNDLTVKLGHYACVMGYEVVAAPGNFFYSHSYCLGYSEEVLATGVQAEYKLSDQWSANAGFNRGWNMFEDINHDMDVLCGLKWHNQDNTSSLSFEIDIGPQDPLGIENRWDYALVFKQTINRQVALRAPAEQRR